MPRLRIASRPHRMTSAYVVLPRCTHPLNERIRYGPAQHPRTNRAWDLACFCAKSLFFFVKSEFSLHERFIRMNVLTPELVQRAFRIKYGYPTELSADEIYQEFERRYNLALNFRQNPGNDFSWTKILEGMSLLEEPKETETERQRRRSAIERLAATAGYSSVELDLLAEEYLSRLEVRWIQEG